MPTTSRGVTTVGSEEIQPPPRNAKFLEFVKSDGNAFIRPTPTQPVKDASGQVNFYRLVPLDEKSSTMWRKKIGSKVASMLGYSSKSAIVVCHNATDNEYRRCRLLLSCGLA